MVQKEVEKARVDEKLEANSVRAELLKDQHEKAGELMKKFKLVRQASDNGNVVERGLAEIASKSIGRSGEIADKGRILTTVEVGKAKTKLVVMKLSHENAQIVLDAQIALNSQIALDVQAELDEQVALDRGGVGSTLKVPSVLEIFFF